MMLRQYLPILIFMGLATVLGLALFTIGWILGPRRPDAEKLSPYECGFEAFEDSRMRFDVRYYLVAIIFIVFDLEIAFFFPWAVSLRDHRHLRSAGHADFRAGAGRRAGLRLPERGA